MRLNPEFGVWRVQEQVIVAGETRWVISRSPAFAGLIAALLKNERDGRRRVLPLLHRAELTSRHLLRGAALKDDPEAAERGRAAFARFTERHEKCSVVPIDDYQDRTLTDAVAGCQAGDRVYPVRVGAFPLVAGPVFGQDDTVWLTRIRQRIAGRRQIFDLASSEVGARCLKPRPPADAALWNWMADDLLARIEAHLSGLLDLDEPSLLVAGGDGAVSLDRALPPRPDGPAPRGAGEQARSADNSTANSVDLYAGPISGIVGDLSVEPALPGAPVYRGSGLEAALAGWPGAGSTPSVRDYIDACEYGSAGYGHSAEAARRSVVFEAVEGYCWLYRGDEPTSRGRIGDFDSALSAQDFLALSDRQVEAMPAPAAELFKAETVSSWARLRPLRRLPADTDEDRSLWVQAPLMFGCHPEIGQSYLGRLVDVNGLGCGATHAAARRHALLEVMERDAVAIWWYAGGPAAAVDLDAVSADTDAALRFLLEMGRDAWLLNIPNDFGVKVVVAVSCDQEGRRPLFGFGAGLRLVEAARRASAELYLRLDLVAAPSARSPRQAEGRTGDALTAWCETARVDDYPWLTPSQVDVTSPEPSEMDVEEDVGQLLDCLQRIGLSAYELDLSRPDVPVPVVRIVVPGCRHFRNRFGPGRRTSVPKNLGWPLKPGWESAPNPMPECW